MYHRYCTYGNIWPVSILENLGTNVSGEWMVALLLATGYDNIILCVCNVFFHSCTAVNSLGPLPTSMEVKSLPSCLPDTTDNDLPPPIPPKQFLEEELFPPPPKVSESGEPHWNITPLLPPKPDQEDAALTPHPPSVHQQSGDQWVGTV